MCAHEGSICVSYTLFKVILTDYTGSMLFVAEPELRINPRYFLKVPTDSYAKFQCACDPRYTSPCDQYQMSWSFIDKYTGAKKDVFRNGTVLESPDIYKVKSGNGTSEFSIDGRCLFKK